MVIIGAGAAGVAAAIDAAEAGLRPLVLEAFPEYGGAAATSGGGCCMVATPLQASLGIQDSVQLALNDWVSWSEGTVDTEWARFYLSRSCRDLYEWLRGMGVEWIGVRPQEGNTVPRWHSPKGEGWGLMRALYETARNLPVRWRFSAEVTRLLVDGNGVAGVEVDTGGRKEEIRSRAVLVATGGFNNRFDLISKYVPDPGPGGRILCGGARQALGKGHRLLEDAGALFSFVDRIWMYPYGTPDHEDPEGRRGFAVRNMTDEIWVNAQGRRFHNEAQRGGKTGMKALWAQSPRTCWSIFDRGQADRLTLADPRYRHQGEPLRERIEAFLNDSPFVHHADTVEELARAAGLPESALAETVRRWNGWVQEAAAGGVAADPEFGRPLGKLNPIVKPPFFALQYFPMARKNFGGVRTDLSCRVLRRDGSVIPGLYAAGEVAGMAGGFLNGRAGLEGTMLGPSLFSGRVAGRAVAQDLAAVGRGA